MITSLLVSFALADAITRNGDFQSGLTDWNASGGASARVERQSGDDPNVPAFVRFELSGNTQAPTWDAALTQSPAVGLGPNKTYALSFWARGTEGHRISAFLQENQSPYRDNFREEVRLTTAWRRYEVSGSVDDALPAGRAQYGFHLNTGKGRVDLGRVELREVSVRKLAEPLTLIKPNEYGTWRIVGVDTGISGGVLSAKFTVGPNSQPWNHLVGAPFLAEVRPRETVRIKFQARSRARSTAAFMLEQANEPHAKYLTAMARLKPEWTDYTFAGRIPALHGPGTAQFTVFLGYQSGEAEFRNVRIENLGDVDPATIAQSLEYYPDGKRDLTWLKDAERRIEQNRKGGVRIIVRKNGVPVKNADIAIQQLRHDFRFGTAAPAALINDRGELGGKFRAALKRYFNTVTFENDLKWSQTAASGYDEPDRALEWLRANGFEVRGHNVVWGSPQYLPPGVMNKPNAELAAMLETRTAEVVGRYKGKLYLWDVVNEAATETALWDKIGWGEFAEMFRRAKRADPETLLCYNDFNITEEAQFGPRQKLQVLDRVKKITDAGAPVDVIGIQAHVGVPMTPMPRVLAILDEMARTGKRLEITEYDLGVLDDKVNGEHMADFVTACFSHPAVDGFIMWGFWEGAHWRAREGGAMIRRDWSERPAAKAYEDLVTRKWWTAVKGKTSTLGSLETRAFYGIHEATVTVGATTKTIRFNLQPGQPNVIMLDL